MTDEQMATFLGLTAEDGDHAAFVKALTPERRALYERMAGLEIEVDLWQAGIGPKPESVLIDTVRSTKAMKDLWTVPMAAPGFPDTPADTVS